MAEIVSRVATQAGLPLVLDSTEPLVLEAGLQHIGGKPILNSANLEEGEEEGKRFDRVMSLASEYGAAVVCMCIDEEGQARTAERKVAIARRIRDLAVERYGIPASDLLFDCNTLTLATGLEESRQDGIETIEGIRRIKTEIPDVYTVLGLSNISFGFKPVARHVLNSVFLHECREAGLDSAIVHAARIMPMHRIDDDVREITLDLIYDRRRDGYDPLQAFLAAFEGVEHDAVEREDRSGWPVEERLKHRIIDGDRDGLEADLEEQLGRLPALAIVNDVLLEGMKVVGELFGSGQMQLPFVLQSAETMKTAVAYLEPHMEKADAGGKGTLVIGTVKGDVHDIGKNLVDIILTNNGYEVHNIGIKAPLSAFLDKAEEVNADAIGMSGLLVKSTVIMRENLEALNERGLADTPVMLGGAALHAHLRRTRPARHLRRPALLRQGRVRRPPHHGHPHGGEAQRNARRRLRSCARRARPRAPTLGAEGGAEPAAEHDTLRRRRRRSESSRRRSSARALRRAFRSTTSPRTSTRPHCSATSGSSAPTRHSARTTPTSRSACVPRCAPSSTSPRPKAGSCPRCVWGYFPVNSEGNELVVWTDDDRTTERVRFNFPRQRDERNLCISDFFRSVESGDADYAAFHVVTIGDLASQTRAGAVRGEPLPGVPALPRALGGDDRGARRAVAPPDP